ncbi:MAG: asparagine synthase (glutamine-hydrolyzing) [Rhodospirillaceae bacterium]|nr:asparagine synthase (glutamine-hydrolyzing) [Rhodospirillaceae bacterium]
MCGIAGSFRLMDHGSSSDAIAELRSAVRALTHRGPDDSGEWSDQRAGISLGHRRLSVVDLSHRGHQPMISRDGRFVLSYNGEVYNAPSLKGSLSQMGITFKSRSDTEVLVEAISNWGLRKTLTALNGMFALAVWDRKDRCLHLARDRFGQKPIYYAWAGKSLVFGSELAAIKEFRNFPANINRDAISLLLRHSSVPAPHTIYLDCWKLVPGAILSVDYETLRSHSVPQPKFYWSAKECAEQNLGNPLKTNDPELSKQLDAVLQGAVADCMLSDAPLGAFLSGGIDSSTIVALMQKCSSRPVKTFSIGFSEASYNEADAAASIAQHLGTEHTELYVTPSEAQAVIPKLPTMYSEPFADSSQIPTYIVSNLAREKVTVALSGDGGDELFGGYNRYVWSRNMGKIIGNTPLRLRQNISKAICSIPSQRWDTFFMRVSPFIPQSLRQAQYGEKIHKLAGIMNAKDKEDIYWKLISQWQNPHNALLKSTEPATLLSERHNWSSISNFQHQMMLMDTVTYLPDDILVKLDRASMSVGLEARVPFLDHRVFEFSWRLPIETKIYKNSGKRILKQVLAKYIPRHLFERPKMGFGVPIGDWLRRDLRSWAEDLLSEHDLKRGGFFEAGTVRRLWLDHLKENRNHQHRLWPVLMFQAWLHAQ